jgi:hypothetical protein
MTFLIMTLLIITSLIINAKQQTKSVIQWRHINQRDSVRVTAAALLLHLV